MAELKLIETLESAWFYSNVFSSKINFEPEPESEPGSSQPPENQLEPSEIRSPANSPKETALTERSIEAPATDHVISAVSRSPRRIIRRRQRSYGGRALNLEGEVEFCRGGIGELKSNAVMKDERAMKRQLKSWAAVVASSSAAHSRPPMLALCC